VTQVCPNGSRTAGVPVSPGELAEAVADAVAAGADDVHLHPKRPDGVDSLAPEVVAAALDAVRAAVPRVPVGITTGAWAVPDPAERLRHVFGWTVRPDHASVNFHEPGAETLARTLLARGIDVHAGLFTGTDGADRLAHSGLVEEVRRILVEVVDGELDEGAALADRYRRTGRVLLHGEEAATWPAFRLAVELRVHTRIGLEDTLVLPDGSPAADNAALVRAARTMLGGSGTA
jgi:uncharacterized protein (DUF849 family)